MIEKTFEFSVFPKMVKNGNFWSKMVQLVSKITQNMKMANLVKKYLGQIL